MTERSIPAAAQAQLERRDSPDALIWFLTIRHPGLPAPVRVVSDVFDYILDGETYSAAPFTARAMSDTDQMPAAELAVANIDRRLGLALERTDARAVIDAEVYSTADFDLSVVPRVALGTPSRIYAHERVQLTDVQADAIAITGRLARPDLTQEPWPGRRATQARFPGLFV